MAAVQLAVADDAFRLRPDVDEDLVLVDPDDSALDDVAVLEALDVRVLLGEELLHRRRLGTEVADRRLCLLGLVAGGGRVGDVRRVDGRVVRGRGGGGGSSGCGRHRRRRRGARRRRPRERSAAGASAPSADAEGVVGRGSRVATASAGAASRGPLRGAAASARARIGGLAGIGGRRIDIGFGHRRGSGRRGVGLRRGHGRGLGRWRGSSVATTECRPRTRRLAGGGLVGDGYGRRGRCRRLRCRPRRSPRSPAWSRPASLRSSVVSLLFTRRPRKTPMAWAAPRPCPKR